MKIIFLWIAAFALPVDVLPSGAGSSNSFYQYQGKNCTVADPTGTPLNVRATPKNAKVVTTLKNGTNLKVVNEWAEPGSGDETSSWSKVSVVRKGRRQVLGWVLSSYLSCQ